MKPNIEGSRFGYRMASKDPWKIDLMDSVYGLKKKGDKDAHNAFRIGSNKKRKQGHNAIGINSTTRT